MVQHAEPRNGCAINVFYHCNLEIMQPHLTQPLRQVKPHALSAFCSLSELPLPGITSSLFIQTSPQIATSPVCLRDRKFDCGGATMTS
jgi:hypothetical protein